MKCDLNYFCVSASVIPNVVNVTTPGVLQTTADPQECKAHFALWLIIHREAQHDDFDFFFPLLVFQI